MKAIVPLSLGVLLLAGCRLSLVDPAPPGLAVACLGEGAAPGNENGPGGFVPRGEARNFYAGAGGRLWYYLNNYYWAPRTAPERDLWVKAEVVAGFCDLRRWPDGATVKDSEPRVTTEYWKVGPGGRSVRLDNHKDYCLVSDALSAGAIEVKVTLTLGRVRVKDGKGGWEVPQEAYVLEHRNYTHDHGIGPERTRFEPLDREPVTEWGYRIPWSTHPERLTRSRWLDLPLPTWSLLAKRAAPGEPRRPVTTPSEPAER